MVCQGTTADSVTERLDQDIHVATHVLVPVMLQIHSAHVCSQPSKHVIDVCSDSHVTLSEFMQHYLTKIR